MSTFYIPHSEDLIRAVERSFSPEERGHVLAALYEIPNLQTRVFIVVFSDGNRNSLDRWIEDYKRDERDVWGAIDKELGPSNTPELIPRFAALGLEAPQRRDHDAESEARVKRFVAEYLILPVERVEKSLRIQDHLATLGMDGRKFMADFAKECWVKLDSFHPERHFESRNDVGTLIRIIHLLIPGKKREPTTITVGDLIDAARSRKFISPA